MFIDHAVVPGFVLSSLLFTGRDASPKKLTRSGGLTVEQKSGMPKFGDDSNELLTRLPGRQGNEQIQLSFSSVF